MIQDFYHEVANDIWTLLGVALGGREHDHDRHLWNTYPATRSYDIPLPDAYLWKAPAQDTGTPSEAPVGV